VKTRQILVPKNIFMKIAKHFLWVIILWLLPKEMLAQRYGNEWINFNQTYYKIRTAQTGIYRITQADLQAAGFPVSSTDPRRLQLFFRGKEQAVVVNGEEDGTFNDTDYLEFYGKRNDGTQDSLLYLQPSQQPHQFYALYSDTTAYFLTYRLDNQPGKRMATFSEANTAFLPAEPFHTQQIRIVRAEDYCLGQEYPAGFEVHWSEFDTGEGWTGYLVDKSQNFDLTVPDIKNTFPAGGRPALYLVVQGRNGVPHVTEVYVGSSTATLRLLTTLNFNDFETPRLTLPLEWTDIAGQQLIIRLKPIGVPNVTNDKVSLSVAVLSFPQTFQADPNPNYFRLTANPAGKSYMEITNPASGTQLYDLTDENNIRRIGTVDQGGKLTAVVNGTAVSRTLFASTGFLPVLPIKRVGFRNIVPNQHNYLIISHEDLRKPFGSVPDPIRAYAEYRASAPGGQHDTLTVNSGLLYDQFSYGEKTPLSIRRFADFMLQNKTRQLYLLLIGGGRLVTYTHNSNPQIAYYYAQDKVMTMGYPGSDVCLTSRLNGLPNTVPAIPTGRLSLNTPEEVMAYLNKIKEHESAPPALWQKHLLHFSGGNTTDELQRFKANVNEFKRIAESKYLGGKVIATFSKITDNPVEFFNVSDQINKGVMFITYYGHSSPANIDIDIGFPSVPSYGYANKGKYPMFLINGCNAGDVFRRIYDLPSAGEDWIRAADKGALAYLANSSLGYDPILKYYTDAFYNTAFADSLFIGKPIGLIHQRAVSKFTAQSIGSVLALAHAQQFVLQADPAFQLISAAKPDYTTGNDKIFLRPFGSTSLTAAVDSFQVGIIVSNLGRTDSRRLSVSLVRTLEGGVSLSADTLYFPPVNYQDTLYITVRNRTYSNGGNNRFEVKVDARNQIDETNENNNTGVLEIFIPSVGAVPLFPPEYSVVNTQPVRFVAQATGVIATNRQYVMELDTSATFTSSIKRTFTATAQSLPAWTTDLLSKSPSHDSTVYYWRVRFNDMPESPANAWAESSFIYISNSPEGWSQSKYPQFSKASLSGINRNDVEQKLEFKSTNLRLTLLVPGYIAGDANGTRGFPRTKLLINDLPVVINSNCVIYGGRSLLGVAFDKNTLVPYLPISNGCGNLPQIVARMNDSELPLGILDNFLSNVKTGDYVLFFTYDLIDFVANAAFIIPAMTQIGANPANLAKLTYGDPYIILGKKGAAPGTATEILGNYSATLPPSQQDISFDTYLTGRNSRGSITSPLIGPANAWTTLHRDIRRSEPVTADNWKLDVLGVDFQGKETVVFSDVKTDAFPLNSLDNRQYPYLKLRLSVEDTVNLTPPLLKRWQVIYKGVPEGVINPDLVAAGTYKITPKNEGQNFSLPFIFQNLTSLPFGDSLTVQYKIRNNATRQETTKRFKVKKLLAEDTVRFNIPVENPIGSGGESVLQVYVNPRILPEQIYPNNIFEVPYSVSADKIHPVLDVTFDGIRIMNGDIVSPQPVVLLSLKDENKNLIRKDTVGVDVFLKKPCVNCGFERLSLSSPEIRWTPAGASNDFRLEYRPAKKLENGLYSLRVQGKDVSGNISGVEPYQVNFEVINESAVTHFYPYPNPFSTSTRFVFTLTGSEIPDQIKIQIMTISGKVVREILQDELGPIRIGNNVSSFAWDGRDEFGDRLANGVYLYRVIVQQNGQALNRRNTAADQSFKKEFGKIYILR
jgi:hypothetical protein